MFLEAQISWQVQHFVNLHVQISWQAQHFVNLHAQMSWQVQHFGNLHAQISWQVQHFGNLHVQISCADFVAGAIQNALWRYSKRSWVMLRSCSESSVHWD